MPSAFFEKCQAAKKNRLRGKEDTDKEQRAIIRSQLQNNYSRIKEVVDFDLLNKGNCLITSAGLARDGYCEYGHDPHFIVAEMTQLLKEDPDYTGFEYNEKGGCFTDDPWFEIRLP